MDAVTESDERPYQLPLWRDIPPRFFRAKYKRHFVWQPAHKRWLHKRYGSDEPRADVRDYWTP